MRQCQETGFNQFFNSFTLTIIRTMMQKIQIVIRLFKVRLLVDHLVSKFKTVDTPGQNISIDEELISWIWNEILQLVL